LDRPLLITLDDVHAADEPSLFLLRFVGEACADANIMILAAYRDGEPRRRSQRSGGPHPGGGPHADTAPRGGPAIAFAHFTWLPVLGG
jgi:hypothetical protein